MKRIIFHVDVNSAFLSWEAVRRLGETGEDIRLIPSAIGGDPEKRTSVILAKSVPAKAYNIKTGEPVSMALRKCPSLFLAAPDFKLYKECSHAFLSICREYTPTLEQFSIDECFLDMTGCEKLYPDILKTADELRMRIRDTLGFTVNVGVGSNRLLAKTAGDFEKPDKTHTLFDYEVPEKLWPLPAIDLLMVGKSTAAKLSALNIRTVGDIVKLGEEALTAIFGVKTGASLYRRAMGIDDSPVQPYAEEAKGYSISTTLEEDVRNAEIAKGILLSLAESVTMRLRADEKKAGCIAVHLRFGSFRNKTHQLTLSVPTDSTMEIYRVACRLFTEMWDKETPVRLLGIALSHVSGEDGRQISMWDDAENAGSLDKAVDMLRKKYGYGAIRRGSSIPLHRSKRDG